MQKYQSKYEMSGISEGKVLQYALILATVQCLEIHHILLLLSLHILSCELIRFTVMKCKLALRYQPPPTLISTQVEYGCVPVSKTGGDI